MVAPLSSGVWVPRQHEWERWWQDLRSQTCSPVKVWAGCSFGDSELSLLSHHVLECVFVAGLLDLIVARGNGIRQRLSSGHGCHTCINLALCTCRSAVVSPIPLTCRFLLQSSGVPVSFYLCFAALRASGSRWDPEKVPWMGWPCWIRLPHKFKREYEAAGSRRGRHLFSFRATSDGAFEGGLEKIFEAPERLKLPDTSLLSSACSHSPASCCGWFKCSALSSPL